MEAGVVRLGGFARFRGYEIGLGDEKTFGGLGWGRVYGDRWGLRDCEFIVDGIGGSLGVVGKECLGTVGCRIGVVSVRLDGMELGEVWDVESRLL